MYDEPHLVDSPLQHLVGCRYCMKHPGVFHLPKHEMPGAENDGFRTCSYRTRIRDDAARSR